AGARGMPAGGGGWPAWVAATPICGPTDGVPAAVEPSARLAAPAGTAATDGAVTGTGALAAGLGVDAGVGAPDSRCPQCWQKANPDGVCLPHAEQMAFPDTAGVAVDGAGAGGSAGLGASAVPHIFPKFIPARFAHPPAL